LLPRLLLDTHVLVRWLFEDRKLSREQARMLKAAVRRGEPVALGAMSLLEIAMLTNQGRLKTRADEFFEELQASPLFLILPLSYEVALEVASLGGDLRDAADRAIVATARVHRLRLLTSDQRIIESKLVSVVA
jgi:PIN domain nuclease of toxin-antitoxin system